MGGRLADGTHSPFTVCIDDVRLEDPQFTRPPKAKASGETKILVNQVGYFANLAKLATLRSDAKQQLDWKLFDGNGREAAYGKSQPAGLDVPSGDAVHIIDFSVYKGTGAGSPWAWARIAAGPLTSAPASTTS
jgi:endoglucanase